MGKDKTVFLTGATGLIGSYLLKLLLEGGHKVYALARNKDGLSAQERIHEVLKFWNVNPNVNRNLTILEGDLIYDDFKIKSKEILKTIENETQVIFHSGALAEFRVALDYARKVNVDGTRNILNFALLCKHLVKVNHLSTAYVVGNRGSIEFNENMLEVGQGFNNTYEQSKYESELLVREYHGKGLHISVFRPSMVVGDSREGKTNNLRLFYQPLRFFSKGYYKEFPMDLKCSMNIINVDTAAKIIYLLGFMKESNTYHVVSPMPTNNRSFTGFVYENTKIKYIKFVPIEKFDFNNWSLALKDLALPFIPYCNHRARFSSEKTQEALHPHAFLYPKMDKHNYRRILAYCKKIGFIK